MLDLVFTFGQIPIMMGIPTILIVIISVIIGLVLQEVHIMVRHLLVDINIMLVISIVLQNTVSFVSKSNLCIQTLPDLR